MCCGPPPGSLPCCGGPPPGAPPQAGRNRPGPAAPPAVSAPALHHVAPRKLAVALQAAPLASRTQADLQAGHQRCRLPLLRQVHLKPAQGHQTSMCKEAPAVKGGAAPILHGRLESASISQLLGRPCSSIAAAFLQRHLQGFHQHTIQMRVWQRTVISSLQRPDAATGRYQSCISGSPATANLGSQR